MTKKQLWYQSGKVLLSFSLLLFFARVVAMQEEEKPKLLSQLHALVYKCAPQSVKSAVESLKSGMNLKCCSRSIILHGESGIGKTALACAMGAQLGWSTVKLSPSHFFREDRQDAACALMDRLEEMTQEVSP